MWDVINVVSALGIIVALSVNLRSVRSQPAGEAANLSRIGAHALFYANTALAIWFFHNWIRLLTLEQGESTKLHHDVVRQLIAVMIPLVLATTGCRLLREKYGKT